MSSGVCSEAALFETRAKNKGLKCNVHPYAYAGDVLFIYLYANMAAAAAVDKKKLGESRADRQARSPTTGGPPRVERSRIHEAS